MKTIGSAGFLALCMLHGALSYAADAAPAASSDTLETVIVTGSRTVQDGSKAPTPVTVLSADEMNAIAPSNLPDALNKLPQFTGSYSQNSGGTFNATSEPLGNYLNLRGLDSGRVLTMLDGQRLAPTGQTNAVDSNIVPQLLVKRVDIVTGGASAAYGSDAVSGVVNYVLDDKFEGIKFDASSGASFYGDNKSYKGSLAGGFALGAKGHVILAADVYNNDGIPRLYDRSWTTGSGKQISRTGAGTLANPFRTQDMTPFLGASVNRSVWLPPGGATGQSFTSTGGITTTIAPGDGASFGTPLSGGTSITGTLNTKRYFGQLNYDLTDHVRGHVTGIYSTAETTFNSVPNNTTNGATGYNRAIRIFGDNPFLTAAARAVVGPGGGTLGPNQYIALTGLYNDIGDVTNDTTNDYTSFQLGLKGEFTDKWSWDSTYNYGKSKQSIDFNEFEMKKLWAAVDVVQGPNGPVCGVTIRNPGFMDNCVPINLMGAYNFTQAARDFVRGDSIKDITNKMQYFNFNVLGDLMKLGGGPLSLAVGAEYRKQDLDVVSNSDPAYYTNADGTYKATKFVNDYMGIRGIDASSLAAAAAYEANPTAPGAFATLQAALGTGVVPGFTALRFNSINQGGAKGSQTVKEFYAELNAPFTDSFSLNLAGRSTDYKTSGRVTTWKAGVSWSPIDSLRIRATQSRDIAAPTLTLLFSEPSPSFGQFIDSHITDGSSQTLVPLYVSKGNPDLQPEKGDTTTAGLVFQPVAVPGLTLSVDYYHIKIKDAFGNLSPGAMLDQCEQSQGTASVCQYIVRPLPWSDHTAANAATQILQVPFNLALLETSGVDFEAHYSFNALGGRLGLRGFVNYVDSYTTKQTANDATIEHVGYNIPGSPSSGNSLGLPRIKGTLMESYLRDSFSFMLSQRWTGASKLGVPGQVWAPDDANIPGGVMPNVIYWDANASYKFGTEGRYQLYVNVQNLTDVTPPKAPGLALNLTVPTDKLTYDVVGRAFTVGLRAKF